MENFLQLIASLQEVVTKMQEQSADFPAQLEQVRAEGVEEGKRSRDTEIAEFGAAERKAGFDEGVASVPPCEDCPDEPPVSDKIYSQAELDAAITAAVSPLNETVSALQTEVDRLNGELSGVDQKISDAIAAVKAELLSRYDATQEDDAAFRESLK